MNVLMLELLVIENKAREDPRSMIITKTRHVGRLSHHNQLKIWWLFTAVFYCKISVYLLTLNDLWLESLYPVISGWELSLGNLWKVDVMWSLVGWELSGWLGTFFESWCHAISGWELSLESLCHVISGWELSLESWYHVISVVGNCPWRVDIMWSLWLGTFLGKLMSCGLWLGTFLG
jgi:hypothetical protein